MFQSTHPSRGATLNAMRCLHKERVSIHAPLAGCDSADFDQLLCLQSFNPRTPRGVRHIYSEYYILFGVFQSTHPSRGATISPQQAAGYMAVSIHAPLAGCDQNFVYVALQVLCFNPRTPRGVRPSYRCYVGWVRSFNPRTPRGVRLLLANWLFEQKEFQSTHPSRGATGIQHFSAASREFQSTHPSRGATFLSTICLQFTKVSIHAPLAGCDCAAGERRCLY